MGHCLVMMPSHDSSCFSCTDIICQEFYSVIGNNIDLLEGA